MVVPAFGGGDDWNLWAFHNLRGPEGLSGRVARVAVRFILSA
jgi:hypothetical protein